MRIQITHIISIFAIYFCLYKFYLSKRGYTKFNFLIWTGILGIGSTAIFIFSFDFLPSVAFHFQYIAQLFYYSIGDSDIVYDNYISISFVYIILDCILFSFPCIYLFKTKKYKEFILVMSIIIFIPLLLFWLTQLFFKILLVFNLYKPHFIWKYL